MTTDNTNFIDYWDNMFQMGSRKLLVEIMGAKSSKDEAKDWDYKKISNVTDKWNEFLLQSQIYISKLLKAENLSFLFGAGPSIPLGAITIRNIPLRLEYQLYQSLSKDSSEIKLLYEITEYLLGKKPFDQSNIEKRVEAIKEIISVGDKDKINEQEIEIPLENFLSFVYCLRSAGINPLKNQNNPNASRILSLKNGEKK